MDNKIKLINKNNKIVVSSREIADNFAKLHKNVLKAVKNLNCSSEFRQLNFEPSSYYNEQNKQQQEYLITRDGFTLLAMGFTGEKAMKFKEDYINAFNKMEEAIKKSIDRNTTINPQILEIRNKNAEARLRYSKVKEANFLLETAKKYENVLSKPSIELLTINAIEIVNGKGTIEHPKLLNEKYYSATEIGEEVGLHRNKIGSIANQNNIKTDEYGMMVLSKSEYSSKQVPTFMYNEKGRARIKEIVEGVKING